MSAFIVMPLGRNKLNTQKGTGLCAANFPQAVRRGGADVYFLRCSAVR